MSISIKEGKLLYHLTPIASLPSIVANGLLSRNDLQKRGISFIDTANHDILNRRERLGLADFIPFHFHIHTSYDTSVKSQNDEHFAYLCISREVAKAKNCFILPIHPASTEQPVLYPYDEGFDRIDWAVMELTKADSCSAGVDDHYRSLVRMAECLVPSPLPVEHLQCIYVKDEIDKTYVKTILENYGITPPPYVNTNDSFFN